MKRRLREDLVSREDSELVKIREEFFLLSVICVLLSILHSHSNQPDYNPKNSYDCADGPEAHYDL